MLDIKLLRESPDLIQQNLVDRRARVFEDVSGEDWAAATVQRLEALDAAFRAVLHEQEEVRRQQNETSAAMKAAGRLPKEEQASARASLVEQGRLLREREHALGSAAEAAQAARDEAWGRVPNLTHSATPRSLDEHQELRRWGVRRDFTAEGFTPQDHLTIAESLDLVDFAAGAKVAGQKFYYLKNDAVLLDLALQRFALAVARRHGFVLHTTPDLARVEILQGLGFNPRGESTQVYSVEKSDLCLVGTAEITLGGMLADLILEEERLPLLLAGLSHCWRPGRGTR
jgi:seryl-tRNA synthetase